MNEFLKGKYPYADRRIIRNNINIRKFLIEKGRKEEAEELKKIIEKQIKKYQEIYKDRRI